MGMVATPPKPNVPFDVLSLVSLSLATPRVATIALVGTGMAAAALVRFWHLNSIGYNSDEAVYAGQGAALANDPTIPTSMPSDDRHDAPQAKRSIDADGA